jgi:hypothetical protein
MPARCELAKIKDGERGEFELERRSKRRDLTGAAGLKRERGTVFFTLVSTRYSTKP